MRSRITAAFLIVAAWFATLCVFAVPSHACCKSSPASKANTVKECCVTPLAKAALVQQSLSSADGPTPDLIGPPIKVFEGLDLGLEPVQQSILASGHVPDQSGRYLELRVLLN